MKNTFVRYNQTLLKRIVTLVIILLFAAVPMSTMAVDANLLPVKDGYTANQALQYAMAPDYLFPFIYYGSDPTPWSDIDTSMCLVDRLYVYNENTDDVLTIVDQRVQSFVATNDYLYFVTADNELIQTDYEASAFNTVYEAVDTGIAELGAFGHLLYFLEGSNLIVVLDSQTGDISKIEIDEQISGLYIFDFDKLIWYDMDGEATYYNMSTCQSEVLENEYSVNCLVNEFDCFEENPDSFDIMAIVPPVYEYNDIDFPLEEYPANEGLDWTMPEVLSYFTTRYIGAGQCDGFAKYAHDKFWHLYDTSRTVPSWQNGNSVTADHKGASPTEIKTSTYVPNNDNAVVKLNSKEDVEKFFEGLSKGAFVRYISKSDTTPYNGTHSIVFAGLSADGTGIYAYEANQDGECGVGYQKYTFAKLDVNYTHVLYYVNHSLNSTGVSENNFNHLVHCNNCDGYLRQSHDIITTIYATQHVRTCRTCNWNGTGAHTYSNNVCTVCGYKKGGIVVASTKAVDIAD